MINKIRQQSNDIQKKKEMEEKLREKELRLQMKRD